MGAQAEPYTGGGMVGKTISHYRLTERIGGGGMGVVWKALDTHLEREAALKFLPEGLTSDASRRERFFREAKAASALNHPNIVTIYEIGSDGGQLFIAMELIRGQALSDVLREHKRLPASVAVDYATQLFNGLGAAHRAGIVHRDVKPSNVMVTDDGIIKILDFGLAKLKGPDSDPGAVAVPLTVPGTAVGTVPYMSPEQAAGDAVGPRSDVFSAGIVLYEMLSGRRPFKGTSNAEIMRALIAGDPPPLLSMAAGVPEVLARITHKCLEKGPESRYGDASEVAGLLRGLDRSSWPVTQDDLPTATMAVEDTASGSIPRRRGLVAGVAVLLLAVAALTGYAWWQNKGSPTPPPAMTTAEALQRARTHLQRYDRKGNVDRAIAVLAPALQHDGSSATLHAALAEAYTRKYSEDADKQWLQKSVESGRRAVAANEDLAAAHVALGMALAASGQNSEAIGEFERARDLNPLSGPAHLGLGRLRSGVEAEQLFQKAVQYSPGEWIPLHELARFYYQNARYDQSIVTWRQTLQAAPDNVLVLGFLGAGLHMNGQYAEAADTFQSAITLDVTNGATWANYGAARYFQGRFADAVRAAEKSVELMPSRYLYWGNLGDSYRWAEGQKSKADGAYQNAIRLVRERLAVAANDRFRSSLAVYLAKSGDKPGALAELARLGHERDSATLFKVALIHELVQDRDKALLNLGRAIRAGYSMHEIANEPELAALRSDPRYAKIAGSAGMK